MATFIWQFTRENFYRNGIPKILKLKGDFTFSFGAITRGTVVINGKTVKFKEGDYIRIDDDQITIIDKKVGDILLKD